jgi:hypothetical protein
MVERAAPLDGAVCEPLGEGPLPRLEPRAFGLDAEGDVRERGLLEDPQDNGLGAAPGG